MSKTVFTPKETTTDVSQVEQKAMIRKHQRPGQSHIYADQPKRIVFQQFNTKTQSLEPYGSMLWNGEEWEVEEDNKFHSIAALLDDHKGFGGQILTKKDRDFYMPFWHTPTTGWKVDIEPVPHHYRSQE